MAFYLGLCGTKVHGALNYCSPLSHFLFVLFCLLFQVLYFTLSPTAVGNISKTVSFFPSVSLVYSYLLTISTRSFRQDSKISILVLSLHGYISKSPMDTFSWMM